MVLRSGSTANAGPLAGYLPEKEIAKKGGVVKIDGFGKKSWWSGDERVEKFMPPIAAAIKRHIEWPSDAYTDIYNRAYEAVYAALQSQLTPSAADSAHCLCQPPALNRETGYCIQCGKRPAPNR